MQLWVQGDITTNVAVLWERGLLVPLRKTWRRDRAGSPDGALVKLSDGVMIDPVFKKLNNIFDATQFSVRTPGGAEAQKQGGLRRRSGGHRSQQRVWKHVETLCAGNCADKLPTDAGNTVHAVRTRKYHSMAANVERVD